MKMLEESTSHPPRATLEVLGQPRSSVCSRRTSRDEAFPGGGLSALSEVGTRDGAVEGRAPLGRMTSSYSLKSSWKLKYQDFLPERVNAISDKGEPFSKLVSRANEWLLRNAEVQLKSCETVTWATNDENRTTDGELMVQTQLIGENRLTYYVRGLRLWLCPSAPVNSAESLAFVDVAPSARADDIQTLIGKVNKKITQNQIKGQIFRIETLPVAFDRGQVDPTITRWVENSNDDKQFVFVLRVFQLRRENEKFVGSGKNRIQTAIKDFVPMPIEQSYEGFETLIERCNNWLQEQTDVSVINFQSLMVQRGEGPFMDMSRSCHYKVPGCRSSSEPLDMFRVLRVVVQRQSNSGGSKSSSGCNDSIASFDSPTIWPFTFESFVPELLRQREPTNSLRERMERMRETFSKVVAFLRISGADVVGVETVMNPIQLYIDSETLNDEEQVFLFTLRIYVTGQTRPRDGSVRSIKRASVVPATETETETGAEEGGGRNVPLFLGSVVQRKFKYRWMILALFGFTCMTIIVFVSVIYSNK